MGGGGGEIEKNIAAKEGKGGRRRGEGGWGHSWGGSIVINIYFLGSSQLLSLLPCAYAQSRLESGYAIK